MTDACDEVDNLNHELENLQVKDEDFETFHAIKSSENEEKKEEPPSKDSRFVIPKDFELLKVIGMGSFGKVLSVRSKSTCTVYAMKVISKRLLKKKSAYIENIQVEREILTKIRHPFVVTMHCSFQSREKLFLIMDFCAGGELFLKIGMEGIFSEKEASFYIAEIILALEYLHKLHVLHRDLKPENILLQADGHVCVTDFGLAKDFSSGDHSLREQQDFAMTICGTGEYMAPEMIAKKGYREAADYWSLGCIAYEMLSGFPPFQSKKGTKDLFRKILQERVKMPPASSAAAHKLLKGLLTRDSTKRLGASKATMFHVGGVSLLKSQDFFKDLNFDLLEKKEVDPPCLFDINHDADTKHFHEEFINMNLPRSVKLMAQGKAKNTKVKSDTFRGFSFIHEDFQLPDRGSKEHEEYWNSVESDGESASEAASSKFDQDSVEATKKRPPRKKKKKAVTDQTPEDKAATPDISKTVTSPEQQPVDKSEPQPVDKSDEPSETAQTTNEPKMDTIPVSKPSDESKETSPPTLTSPTPQVIKPAKPVIKKADPWQTIPAKTTRNKKLPQKVTTAPKPVENEFTPTVTKPVTTKTNAVPAPKTTIPPSKPIPKAISTLSKTAPTATNKNTRPALAVQSTFWPTLGDDAGAAKPKKQLQGAWAVKR